jgi:hypothetical protein
VRLIKWDTYINKVSARRMDESINIGGVHYAGHCEWRDEEGKHKGGTRIPRLGCINIVIGEASRAGTNGMSGDRPDKHLIRNAEASEYH